MVLDNVDAEERLQVVCFRYGVLLFEEVAQFGNELCVTGRDCKIVDVDTEVDTPAITVDLEKETGIVS